MLIDLYYRSNETIIKTKYTCVHRINNNYKLMSYQLHKYTFGHWSKMANLQHFCQQYVYLQKSQINGSSLTHLINQTMNLRLQNQCPLLSKNSLQAHKLSALLKASLAVAIAWLQAGIKHDFDLLFGRRSLAFVMLIK